MKHLTTKGLRRQRLCGLGLGFGLGVLSSGFIHGLGFGVWSSGFIYGLGFMVISESDCVCRLFACGLAQLSLSRLA